ncbi:MAG: PAS domain S-box protein [Chitinophagaceae bacterium]|nr:PAS domain S-box protein [Chitinophagaceae bacterium]
MFTSVSNTKSLTDYFRQSGQFYYLLIDLKGNLTFVNPLFQKDFDHISPDFPGQPVSKIFQEEEAKKIDTVFKQCVQSPGQLIKVVLKLILSDNNYCEIAWEVAAFADESGNAKLVQAIGIQNFHGDINVQESGSVSGKLSERYKAFEKSAEGLWLFESSEPVIITDPPEKIVEYWKRNSWLVECNDNLARMYGFDKADEIIGTSLDQLMDFSDPERVENLKEFIRNGFQTTTVETREFDRNGKIKHFLNQMTGIVENGMVRRVWGTQQDITEQRQAEQQLKTSELFYRNLFSNSLDGILIANIEGVITFASPSITSILGYTTEEVLGKNTFDYAHPDDRQQAISAFWDEINNISGRKKFISVRLLSKETGWMWCMIRGHNLLANPYIKGIVINFYDDTMRKRTEEALIESEKMFRSQATILNNVTDVIVTTDLDRVVTSWNHIIEKLTGITEQEAVGKPFRLVLDTDYTPYTHDQVAEIVFSNGIWKGEVSFVGRDGERKYLLHTVSLLYDDMGNKIGLLGVGRDITERKEAQAKLQESELFYRNMITHSLDGIVMTDTKGNIKYCSPSIDKISGYEPADLLGHSIFEFVFPEDIKSALEAFAMESKNESVLNYISLRLLHANGEWVWCTVRGHNLLDNPTFNAMVIYFTNDSKRKKIEDKLRESERRFRNLIHNLKMGVLLQDENEKMVVTNQAALDLLGLTEDQLLGITPRDPKWNVIHEDGQDFPVDTHPVPVAFRTKKPVLDVVMGIYRPVTNDRVWLLVNAEPVLDGDGSIINVICSFTDITEQKRLSQELIEQEIQKQKQVTQATIDGQEKERREIGKELHDNINQHLNTTRLYLEVAKEKATGEVREMISLSHKNLATIINEIRQMSQSLVPPTLGDLGLVESVQDLCDALKRAHTFNIEFQYRYFNEDNLPVNLRLMLFRIIQEQVSNIIRHAGATTIQIKLQSDAEYIMLNIKDNGKGFDPDTRKNGGLGFSNINTRAALFNGKVEITSAPGSGCSLSVIIPQLRDNQPY